MKRIRVHVTQDHINKGDPCKTTSCPIALALQPHFPGKTPAVGGFFVNDRLLDNSPEEPNVLGYLSSRAREFIELFDGGRVVSPFTFYLRLK